MQLQEINANGEQQHEVRRAAVQPAISWIYRNIHLG